jgi:hypothetical protein
VGGDGIAENSKYRHLLGAGKGQVSVAACESTLPASAAGLNPSSWLAYEIGFPVSH